ncbi:hypothetical protein ZIOFF_026564 [Zingiber officinale]|uniref:Uncharacterized protein n=1 Tax=Zingiber officinale TaxID=94328 RepID=A0A8J5H4Y3_ZINOF|nr:hypothetical protein ZIOFF_026564 [Zingiber officinale]
MIIKDLLASPSAAAALAETTDGPANDEGNLFDAKGLAKEAAFLFQNRRFQECVEILSQIFDKKRGDAKREELAHTFVDQIDSENSCLGYMVSGSKANSASIHQSAAINSSRVAIILYHIPEYTQSLFVLKKLFQNIEPIEEQIALRVCLLLLDVALACEDILQFTNLKYSRVEIDEVRYKFSIFSFPLLPTGIADFPFPLPSVSVERDRHQPQRRLSAVVWEIPLRASRSIGQRSSSVDSTGEAFSRPATARRRAKTKAMPRSSRVVLVSDLDLGALELVLVSIEIYSMRGVNFEFSARIVVLLDCFASELNSICGFEFLLDCEARQIVPDCSVVVVTVFLID